MEVRRTLHPLEAQQGVWDDVAVFSMSRSGHTAVSQWIDSCFRQHDRWCWNQENVEINESTMAGTNSVVLVVRELANWLASLLKNESKANYSDAWWKEMIQCWKNHSSMAQREVVFGKSIAVALYPVIATAPLYQQGLAKFLGAPICPDFPTQVGSSAFVRSGTVARDEATCDRWAIMEKLDLLPRYREILEMSEFAWEANRHLFRTNMPRLILDQRTPDPSVR